MGLEPASVRPSVRASTLSNMNIFETSRSITTKFYLKHHWGGGKAALGFDADQIRTLVSMATDSSHSNKGKWDLSEIQTHISFYVCPHSGKGRHHVFSTVFDRILFILAGNDDIHKSLHEFEIRPDPTTDNRVSCP